MDIYLSVFKTLLTCYIVQLILKLSFIWHKIVYSPFGKKGQWYPVYKLWMLDFDMELYVKLLVKANWEHNKYAYFFVQIEMFFASLFFNLYVHALSVGGLFGRVRFKNSEFVHLEIPTDIEYERVYSNTFCFQIFYA